MNTEKIEKKKPTSVYVFGTLFLLYYILCLGVSIKLIFSPEIIISNIYLFSFSLSTLLIGIVSSAILLFSQKYKIVKISFSILTVVTILATVTTFIVSLITTGESPRSFLAIILLINFCFKKSFKSYFLSFDKRT